MVESSAFASVYGSVDPQFVEPLRQLHLACAEVGFATVPQSLTLLVIRVTREQPRGIDVYLLVYSLKYYG